MLQLDQLCDNEGNPLKEGWYLSDSHLREIHNIDLCYVYQGEEFPIAEYVKGFKKISLPRELSDWIPSHCLTPINPQEFLENHMSKYREFIKSKGDQ